MLPGAWITTYTGITFFPANPNIDGINICDIAHALSQLCRYGGHTSSFYSVAEHSARLVDIVPKRLKPLALLHDGAEAYMLDVPHNLKNTIFKDYSLIENPLIDLILVRFGIPEPTRGDWMDIKKAEYTLLATEVRDLMSINSAEWYLPERPLPAKIVPAPCGRAERMFLHRFHKYVNESEFKPEYIARLANSE